MTNVDDAAHRQAVYYAPAPEHPLWVAGCDWLGRDPARPDDRRPAARPHVGKPWRYGFHATLKTPMRLARPQEEWLDAVAALAARTPRFLMPALSVDWLGDFIAVKPVGPLDIDHPLQLLADACVIELDEFRAPPEPDQPERPNLSPRQRDHLQRYGYPWVLEEWRFHMTLTDGLDELNANEQAALKAQARDHFAAALAVPLMCDNICIFVEPAPAPFVLTHRFELAS